MSESVDCGNTKGPSMHLIISYGLVARLCCSWLSLGKATRIFYGRNSHWDNKVSKNPKKKHTEEEEEDSIDKFDIQIKNCALWWYTFLGLCYITRYVNLPLF